MDNPVDYVDMLLRRQINSVGQIGVQPLYVDRQTWLVSVNQLISLGVVMKALVDKGVITDEEWQARIDSALDGEWPAWILAQSDPDAPSDPGDDPGTGGGQ